jgi:hypothetical protein
MSALMATFILLLFFDLLYNFSFWVVENLYHIDLLNWNFDRF